MVTKILKSLIQYVDFFIGKKRISEPALDAVLDLNLDPVHDIS